MLDREVMDVSSESYMKHVGINTLHGQDAEILVLNLVVLRFKGVPVISPSVRTQMWRYTHTNFIASYWTKTFVRPCMFWLRIVAIIRE
jgi:hypothetical protein